MTVLMMVSQKNAARFGSLLICLILIGFCRYGWADDETRDEFPNELTKFQAVPHNPLFQGAGPKAWDAKIRERGWIMRDGDQWRLWYTGYDETENAQMKLGLATSRDGVNWVRDAHNPIYADHWVEDMMIVRRDGDYFMFAEGSNDRAQLLKSANGREWKRIGALDVRMKNGDKISDGPYGTPTAWQEEGVWHLFYERRDAGVWVARSTDLAVWTNVSDDPVLKIGPDEYDRLMIAMNQVIKHNGRYYALYHGTGTPQKPRLWTTNLAMSNDLVHWKKYPGNPLLPETDNKSSGIFVHDGKQFRLYTMHPQVHLHLPAKAK